MEDDRLLAFEEVFVGNLKISRDFCKDIHISVNVMIAESRDVKNLHCCFRFGRLSAVNQEWGQN